MSMSLEDRHLPKYNTELCNNKMSFEECELAIIRHAVDENEKIHGEEIIRSEDIQSIIHILEEFIIRKKVICYGGIAINNILPKNAQFYDKNSDIPDYDFFTPNALEDAKELADLYYAKGYTEVEAKSGMYVGTYKVFVNFIPIADLTYIDPGLFKKLEKDAINIAGIYYTPPDFLRMSIYLEFSRPSGYVARWEKIYKRLKLLNQYYPFANKLRCRKEFPRHKNPENENLFFLIRESLIQQGVVFFGSYAISLYARHDKQKVNWKIPDFDVLAEDPTITAFILKDLLVKKGYKHIKEISHEKYDKIIPPYIEIMVGSTSVVKIYYPIACHNYNTIRVGNQDIHVATIDTILSFYLAFLYTDKPPEYKEKLLCMAKFLFDLQAKNQFQQKGLLKRFDMQCIGKQPTMEEMRAEKAEVFNELKDKKGSREYDTWFLRYIPKEKVSGKQWGMNSEKQGEPEEPEEPEPKYKKKRKHKTKKYKKNTLFPFLEGNTTQKRNKNNRLDKRKQQDYLY